MQAFVPREATEGTSLQSTVFCPLGQGGTSRYSKLIVWCRVEACKNIDRINELTFLSGSGLTSGFWMAFEADEVFTGL